MSQRSLHLVHSAAADHPRPAIPSSVLGMLIFILTECMLFAGMISAFLIIKASALVWPPPGQPRLPLEETLINTAALLASGAMLFVANRRFRTEPESAKAPMLAALALAAFFVVFQGVEWVRLLGEGLTLTSSSLGSFFYLIVGTHALHAIAAIVALAWVYRKLLRRTLLPTTFWAVQAFWYFVVGMWPILYLQVYL